jgi:hypothetical protein
VSLRDFCIERGAVFDLCDVATGRTVLESVCVSLVFFFFFFGVVKFALLDTHRFGVAEAEGFCLPKDRAP